MKPFEHRYAPGQIHAAWFRCGSAIVALEGTLRLTYRDASLDWLLGDAPKVTVTLCEGDCHVLPYEAFVEVLASGQRAAVARIDTGPRGWPMAATIGRSLVSRSLVSRWLVARWLVAISRLSGALFRRG